MEYIQNSELMNKLVREVLRARCYHYSDDPILDLVTQLPGLSFQNLSVDNEHDEKLLASLFSYQQATDTCIIFMHGLGSTRLQGLNILRNMSKEYSLCLFDFSGCGKSIGTMVTYGCKQKQDIKAVLQCLRSKGFKKFVLWGRSMGAVATLLYSATYNPPDVSLLVLDSAFSSFEDVSKELTNKKTKLPLFMIEVAVEILKTKFKGDQYDPFSIDLVKAASICQIPALFVYSLEDEVIKSDHSLKIIDSFPGEYEKVVIPEGHNLPRTKKTLEKVFDIIQVYRNRARKNVFARSKAGINMVSSSKPKRPGSAVNNRRSIALIKDRLLSGILTSDPPQPQNLYNKPHPLRPSLNRDYYFL